MGKLSLKEKIFYSFGSLGMGVVTVNHMLFLVWFFIHDSGAGFPYFIQQEPVIFGLTIMGGLLVLKSLFDAISDPIIAHISDRFNPKKGVRTTMLKYSALPFGISYFMVFLVPVRDISAINVVWIAIWIILCTFFLTVYSINHEALLGKITKSSSERIDLGTIASASWFVGFVLVSLVSALWGPLQETFGISKLNSILITFGVASFVGAIFLIIPGLFLDERKFEGSDTVKLKTSVIGSIVKVMRYPNYRRFVLANTLYTSATVVFESGLIFFITILAVMEEGMTGIITIVVGVITLLMYPLINKMTKLKGRKIVLMFSFATYVITFLVISIMSPNPSPWLYLGIIIIVAPFSQAGFGILPVVIANDNAEYMLNETGEDMSGMYMAVSGFFRKIGTTIASILLTSFLVLGKEVGDDMGIRIAVLFAGLLSLVGLWIMRLYNEKEVMKHNE